MVSAFASIVRRLVFGGLPDSEEGWRRHLASAGFDEEAVMEIMECAMTVLMWQDAGLDEHTLALIRESHKVSWFTIDGICRLSKFVSGTLAGTSLADLVFIIAISRVVSRVEMRLKELNLVTQVATGGACTYFGLNADEAPISTFLLNPLYVDDYALTLYGRADSLLQKGAVAMRVMWQSFLEFKLQLIMEAGKTALLPFLHGPGCAAVQREVAGLPGGILVCPRGGGEVIRLHVVKSYKHMGRRACPNGDIMPEIAARYSTTKTVFRPLTRKLFKKESVPLKEKMPVAGSLLLSRPIQWQWCVAGFAYCRKAADPLECYGIHASSPW